MPLQKSKTLLMVINMRYVIQKETYGAMGKYWKDVQMVRHDSPSACAMSLDRAMERDPFSLFRVVERDEQENNTDVTEKFIDEAE